MEVRQFKVFMAPDAGAKVSKTLASGFVGEGPRVKEFEKALGDYLGVKNVVSVNSGTSALYLALKMAVKPCYMSGMPAVVTTPLTCFATTASILQAGMYPVWCDVDQNTCNISLSSVKNLIEEDPFDAIIVVHYGGYPVDMQKLDKILGKHVELYGFKPVVIEDCAHALGASTPWGMVGNGAFGNYCCMSFQAIKTLTTGDGGALICPQTERAKKLRWFGFDRDKGRKGQDVEEAGYKLQMNDIAATIGLANIEHLDGLVARQQDNVRWYMKAMPDIAPRYNPLLQTAGWMYPVTVGNAQEFDRAMADRGVQTGLTHENNYKYTCVKRYSPEYSPAVPFIEKTVSCIPSGWWVTNEEREYVIDCIIKGW